MRWTSIFDGPTPTTLRVLEPDRPAEGQPHRFVYLLPVEPDLDHEYRDGLDEARAQGFHNAYNLTLIEPTFHGQPWIGDHPTTRYLKWESFITKHLRQWVIGNLTQSGEEEHWLVSFSKGGFSALGLIMRNPTLFDRAAAWDFTIGSDVAGRLKQLDADKIYINEAGALAYDPVTNAAAWKGPFLSENRIWISGDNAALTADTVACHDEFVAQGILHTWVTGATREHNWHSGWLSGAIAALAASPPRRGEIMQGANLSERGSYD